MRKFLSFIIFGVFVFAATISIACNMQASSKINPDPEDEDDEFPFDGWIYFSIDPDKPVAM